MRVTGLTISGFRGFATEHRFDFDADAVVVVGVNGLGKTSLLDAILWGLTGRIHRLGTDSKAIISKFADSGEARVSITLETPQGGTFEVVRSFDGELMRVSVRKQTVVQGPAADAALIEELWPTAAYASHPMAALADIVTRTVYLQQDVLRQFVDATTEQERFAAVSELVGVGRVTELQTQLERAKAAWTRATNARDEEANPLRQKLASLEHQLERLEDLSNFDHSLSPETWNAWWDATKSITGTDESSPSLDSQGANDALDKALRRLDAIRSAVERRLRAATQLGSALSKLSAERTPQIDELRARVSVAANEVERLRSELTTQQARDAEQRRFQTELQDREDQVRALASLALKHLGEVCPVCSQEYDVEATRKRLEQIVESAGLTTEPESVNTVPQLAKTLADAEKQLAEATATVRKAENQLLSREAVQSDVNRLRAELEAPEGERTSPKSAALEQKTLSRKLLALANLRKQGEEIAVAFAAVSGEARASELRREIVALNSRSAEVERDITERRRSGDSAQSIIDVLRDYLKTGRSADDDCGHG